MPINKDPSIPPPMIGKIGPYTVFVTPPSTPTPTEPPVFESPKKVVAPPAAAPPVLPPPQQFDKSFVASRSDGSVLGFFKNAAPKVQNEMKKQFGIFRSFRGAGSRSSRKEENENVKVKEISSKIQSV